MRSLLPSHRNTILLPAARGSVWGASCIARKSILQDGALGPSDSYVLGDVNYDNVINVLDIVLLVNIIIDQSEYDSNADLNDDAVLNVLDIVILVNIIMEG